MKYKLRPGIKRGLEIIIILLLVLFLTNTNSFSSYAFDFDSLNEEVGLVAMATKNEEEKPKPVVKKKVTTTSSASYVTKSSVSISSDGLIYGSLTGYASDCPACSGRLACTGYNVYRNGVVTYPDATYGEVRIVASSRNIACGSIVAINSSLTASPMVAIVLDRGVGGNNLDLLVASEAEAYRNVGRKSVSYTILRSGW